MKTYDSAQGLAFLISQLAYIEKKVYEKKYKAITYPDILPVTNEAGEGATSIIYFSTDMSGKAKIIGAKSRDVPIVEISNKLDTISVERGGIGYEYTDEEIRQALFYGVPLPLRKAQAARRAYEELIQNIAMEGSVEHNVEGFINNSNVSRTDVTGTTWDTKTPDEWIEDINTLMGGIFVDSKQIERPDKLGLPTLQWNKLAGTRLEYSDMNAFQWIVNNSPYLNSVDDIIPMPELTGAGLAGKDRMVAYSKDEDKVVFHIPMPLRFTEPQRQGLGFIIPGEFKVSSVEFRYPGSARYADGI